MGTAALSGDAMASFRGVLYATTRRNSSQVFTAKVALAALKGEETVAQLASALTSIRTRSRRGSSSSSART